MAFLIIVCERCGALLLAKTEQKSRTCSYCGFRVEVRRAKRVAAAKTAFEASERLRQLKMKSARKNC
ncbi:MAG: DUF1922 domain-containing protein [Candidatus Bathyarchaeia archaeon]